jgi:hypothetical protein
MAMTSRHRPSYDQLRAAGAAEEREACVEFIRDRIAAAKRLNGRGLLDQPETSELTLRLDALADGIAKGLHR